MDKLWAPWRLQYVASGGTKPGEGCFVCGGLAESDDRANLIAWRGHLSTVILNRFPYNNGHLMVAPLTHKGNLEDLSTEEMLDLQQVVRHCVSVLKQLMNPDGFNVGLNLGRVAGAGLPGHLHWHVVPRWNGDTNFMPVLGETKVISQSLEALFDLIHEPLQDADS